MVPTILSAEYEKYRAIMNLDYCRVINTAVASFKLGHNSFLPTCLTMRLLTVIINAPLKT